MCWTAYVDSVASLPRIKKSSGQSHMNSVETRGLICAFSRQSLHQSLHILDCYRVCLLQRPPSLLWRCLHQISESTQPKEVSTATHSVSLDTSNEVLPMYVKAVDEFSLSELSPFLWPATLLAPADDDIMEILTKPEFVELAADNWLRSQSLDQSVEPASLILYHLMNIVMHANISIVQRYADWWPSRKETPVRDWDHYQGCIQRWVIGRHYPVAKWHAEGILECADQAVKVDQKEDRISARCVDSRRQRARISAENCTGRVDIAHIPYAIFYATLILWCGAADGQDASIRSTHLVRGRNLLSRQRLRIAALLERVLRKVEA